jgi:hypothetical protein
MGDKMINTAVQMDARDGVATIEQGTPLTRLHYFDGKFLRADALTLEQEYHRTLVRMANLAGGWGVVHGLGVSVAANLLTVAPGLAITPAGSTVLLSNPVSVEVAKLLAAASPSPAAPNPGAPGTAAFHACEPGAAAPTAISPGLGFYEITVGPLQGLCGNEEVYGKLCEDACVTDSQSPYWKEGMVLRLRPITLGLATGSAVPPAAIHLRNRVAASYFAAEPWLTASLLSGAGLASAAWCNPALLYNRDEVPIGLLVQEGATTRFIDAWSARRERMDTQARGYWQGRLMMRPWNVFLAQILQFQCQLPGVFTAGSAPVDDACQDIRDLLQQSLQDLRRLRQDYADSSRQILQMLGQQGVENQAQFASALSGTDAGLEKLTAALAEGQDTPALPARRLLINAGFLDLPPAGYLPVDPARPTVNDQLKRFFGEGVNLFFCAARPDYIPHAVEEVQHMERISLTRGLDDATQREDVEVFVPNGAIVDSAGSGAGTTWRLGISARALATVFASFDIDAEDPAKATTGKPLAAHPFRFADAGKGLAGAAAAAPVMHQGLMRTTRLGNGGAAQTMAYRAADAGQAGTTGDVGGYVDWRILDDPFARQEGDQVGLQVEHRIMERADDGAVSVMRVAGAGLFTIDGMYPVDSQTMGIDGVAELQLQLEVYPSGMKVNANARTRLKIARVGDAKTGQVVLFPEPNAGTQVKLAWQVAWQTPVQQQPRTASVVATIAMASSATGAPAAEKKVTMAEIGELATTLQPEHPLRLAALNLLGEVAGLTDDPAFLARARRNLFPDTVVARDEMLVRATLDWVMFRRRRHADCDRRCLVPAETPPVTVQVWHVRLPSTKLFEALLAAVDADSAEAAKQFTFERVDVLHYADVRTTPQETVNQIVADWQAHNPGKAGVLGRAWAGTPALQGEPHLARLVRFCDTISAVTTAPEASSLRVLPQPPTVMADAQFGGGMLVASIDRQEQDTQQLTHRVYLVELNFKDKVNSFLDRGGSGVAKFLEDVAALSATVDCVDGVPEATGLKKIVTKFKQLAGTRGGEATLLLSKSVPDKALIEAQHQAVLDPMKLQPAATLEVDEPDFGSGVPGASLVYFRQG